MLEPKVLVEEVLDDSNEDGVCVAESGGRVGAGGPGASCSQGSGRTDDHGTGGAIHPSTGLGPSLQKGMTRIPRWSRWSVT